MESAHQILRAATVALFLVVGCAPATTFSLSISPTDLAVAEAALAPGDATIRGSALIRQSGGGVVTCAGTTVYLVPATASTTDQLEALFGGDRGYFDRGGSTTFGGGAVVIPPAPNRETICDAQGFFRFTEIRAGRWHLMTTVTWTVRGGYQGGTLLATAEVEAGKEVEIVLTY